MTTTEITTSATERSRSTWPAIFAGRTGLNWFWFAVPSIVLIATFFLLPFGLNALFSFARWTSFSSSIVANGFDNFLALQRQGVVLNAVMVTLIYALIGSFIQNSVGLSLALVLKDTNTINSFFRSFYFLPVLISPLAAGYIWAGVFDPAGPLNDAISFVLGRTFDFSWFGNSVSAIILVAFVDAWKWCGFATLIYIAGLNGIPKEMMQAAEIDGATPMQRFRLIQVPLLAPAFTFNIVITLIGAFNAYDIILATTRGGPGNATEALNVAMWRQWSQGMFGMASTLSFVIALLVITIGIPLIWWLRRREIEL